MKEKKELVVDVRVVERHIREGVLRKEDYEDYLKKLPDVTDKSCPLIVDEETTELESKLENEGGETE